MVKSEKVKVRLGGKTKKAGYLGKLLNDAEFDPSIDLAVVIGVIWLEWLRCAIAFLKQSAGFNSV